MQVRSFVNVGIFGALALSSCDTEPAPSTRTTGSPLSAVCFQPGEDVPATAWMCGDPYLVECQAPATHIAFIYARPPADLVLDVEGDACLTTQLRVSNEGPWVVGEATVEVYWSLAGDEPLLLCSSPLTVVDTVPPEVAVLPSPALWPPNHKVHEITIDDCIAVHDTCDLSPIARFTGASSDEAVDDQGDGNTEADIVDLRDQSVGLRAERSGGGDGRVYRLDFEVIDHANNRVTGTCDVTVPHDQGQGATVDSGAAYRVAVGL